MHFRCMTTDKTLYLHAAVKLAGVNRFYMRRVVQRWQRGELTLDDAAELLTAAALESDASI